MTDHSKSIIFTSYSAESEIGQYNKMQRIASELEQLLLSDEEGLMFDQYINPNYKTDKMKVVALKGHLDRIDTFMHPIYHKGKVFIDSRPFVNKADNSIRDSYTFTNLLKRGFLDLLWVEDAQAFEAINRLMIDAFSSWISNGVSRALSLDIKLTHQIRIVAAIYMLSALTLNKDVDEENIRDAIILSIPGITYSPANIVQDILEMHPTPIFNLYKAQRPTIKHLVEAIGAISNALAKIDKSTIYNSVCRGAIPVTNGTQIAGIGIEHPATFVSMIDSSINSKTGLGLVLHPLMRRNNMEGFNRFIKVYVQDYQFKRN